MKITIVPETYLSDDPDDVARVHNFLDALTTAGRERTEPQFFLSGAGLHEQVELPPLVYEVLLQVVSSLARGLAVTVSPQSLTLTTQQAADLLGVSRPTVIRLLDDGKIPYEKPGRHRRLNLEDVIAYREKRRQRQYDALDALPSDDAETITEALSTLKDARRAAGAERRARRI